MTRSGEGRGDGHSGDSSRNRMFPVGLYGTLLAALFGVTFPQLLEPVENVLRTVVTLPLRAYSILLDARPVLAAERPGAALGSVEGQAASVLRGASGPANHTPLVCRVLERNRGPLGIVDELVLDRSRLELRGCARLVTAGPGLLGFLDTEAGDLADPVRRAAPARVRLLHYRPRHRDEDVPLRVGSPARAARVPAQVTCREVDAQGTLRFLVVPARSVDSWPLRCTLLDDSYLGSRLRHSGDLVTTSAGEDRAVPKGLHIGKLMIWGYPQLNIPVGLFVEPVADPRGISAVVVWEAADGSAVPRPAEWTAADHLVPVRFARFPAPRPAGERWLVTASAGTVLPDGAALVDGDRLIGVLQRPWSGQSLVTPFAASTKIWALLLRDEAGHVIEVVGRVDGRAADGRLKLAVLAPAKGWRRNGVLFSGANGSHCPAGFRIGAAEASAAREGTDSHGTLLVARSSDLEVRGPQVFVGPTAPASGGVR